MNYPFNYVVPAMKLLAPNAVPMVDYDVYWDDDNQSYAFDWHSQTMVPPKQADIDALKPAMILDGAKKTRKDLMTETCKSVITGGFVSSALGAAWSYPSKEDENVKDQSNLHSAVAVSTNAPVGWTVSLWCQDSTGVWQLQPHDATQIQQVGLDFRAHLNDAIGRNADRQAAIDAALSVRDVEAIVW